MIRIALPNKGSLSEEALRLVHEAGYKARRAAKELSVIDTENDVDFLFLRPRDIAVYVGEGIVDLGITGRDLLADSQAGAKELLALGFGKSRFCYATPKEGALRTVDQLDGRRIASSYPNIVKADFAARGRTCTVVKLDGAVEISVALGVADAIADVVESGTTMAQAGLAPIGEPVMLSEAIVIGAAETASAPQARTFLRRLQGILTAQAYVLIEYDVDEAHLAAASRLTPGIEAPTVSQLSKAGWYAVKAMIPRKQCNAIIDNLEDAGAKGIIVSDLRTCRL